MAIRAKAPIKMPAITPCIAARFLSTSRVGQNKDDDGKNPINSNDTAKDEGKAKEGEAATPTTETPNADAASTSTEDELKAVSLKLKEIQVI